jgi:Tfp pilus assembly protein PilX
MRPITKHRPKELKGLRQRGLVLFFALIALLVLSLAAAALVRSVDTSTLIAGNLAFRQAATTSADAGVEAAIAWLKTQEAGVNASKNVLSDSSHTFNTTDAASGYYSNASTASLTDGSGFQWDDSDSKLVAGGPDSSGNTLRYIIQRMCRNAGLTVQDGADCLFGSAPDPTNSQAIALPQDICKGPGCPTAGQAPQIRITVQAKGPKNTVSYVQAFVY